MDMRILIVTAVAASITGSAFAQTQRTGPTAYPTIPTISSAHATSAISPCYSPTNPTSPCYFDSMNPSLYSYSAMMPIETTNPLAAVLPASSLNQAKLRIKAKGYSNISELQKDSRGIWRGKATMKDGRPVIVILDLEGNVYSELKP
jgi:hypothetical protein